MPQPYDYFGGAQAPNLGPYYAQMGENLAKGLQAGLQAREEEQLRQQQMAQERMAMLQFEADRQVLREAVGTDAGPKAILDFTTKYPKLAEAVKMSVGVISQEQSKNEVNALATAYAAIDRGYTDTFNSSLDLRAQALEAAGKKAQAESLRSIKALADKDPLAAKMALGTRMAALNPEQFKAVFESLSAGSAGMEQSKEALAKAKAEAKRAAIAADFEQRAQESGLAKDNAQIENWEQDNKIKLANLALAKAKFELEKEQDPYKKEMALKEFEMKKGKYDQELRDQRAKMDSAIYSFARARKLIKEIMSTPDDVRRAAHGTLDKISPTIQPDVYDYEKKLGTLGAMNFRLMTEGTPMAGVAAAETRMMTDSAGSLDLGQSVHSVDNVLKDLDRMITETERIAKERFGDVSPSGQQAQRAAEKQGARPGEPIYNIDFDVTR